MFFTPSTYDVQPSDKCLGAKNFTAKVGMVIEGVITPPVLNAIVTATHYEIDDFDQSVALYQISTPSDKEGNYKVGPMQKRDYKVSASL
jgi:hypothetical protein